MAAFTRDQVEAIQRILGPLANRIANTGARVVVQLVNDSVMHQLLQIEAHEGEVIDDGEHFQPYGFTAIPLPGAEGVALFPNGDRGHPLVLVVSDRRYRPTDSEPGEVVVYNHTGAEIRMTALGDIVATPAPGRSVLLGSAGAAESAIKGDTFLDGATPSFGLLTLLATMAASLSTLGEADAATLMGNPAWAAMLAAVRSDKVKLE